ncbi:class E sortase [Actinomadura graeca]|uniref:Class E sortase n=1 Tax=Actinomadura graeca TaxID=2750812 RepID=A0ABX8QWX4_9ACTN|nr:class E sortase [Actinomadura graeca]QXJ22669.1 class E sortase [Actinomadura graeca]
MLDRTSRPAAALAAGLLTGGLLTAVAAPPAHAAPAGARRGAVIAKIRIKRIGLRARVLHGIAPRMLQRGVGHYPGTAYPGQEGNTVLLGHRTTYLAPFGRINELRRGDRIVLSAGRASYVYRVKRKRIIRPRDRRALEAVPFKRGSVPDGTYVTLISCHPRGSDRRRLVVVAALHHTSRRPR